MSDSSFGFNCAEVRFVTRRLVLLIDGRHYRRTGIGGGEKQGNSLVPIFSVSASAEVCGARVAVNEPTIEEGSRPFQVHESAQPVALDGVLLANFWQRSLGYLGDLVLVLLLLAAMEIAWRHFVLRQQNIEIRWDFQ
jgi:hypothetical protein